MSTPHMPWCNGTHDTGAPESFVCLRTVTVGGTHDAPHVVLWIRGIHCESVSGIHVEGEPQGVAEMDAVHEAYEALAAMVDASQVAVDCSEHDHCDNCGEPDTELVDTGAELLCPECLDLYGPDPADGATPDMLSVGALLTDDEYTALLRRMGC